ncbi:MAG: hypothetical protein JXM70_10365, partial [Pirellulales bacterium]|nr:hypothetical protein [Pirellulales bacterium]
MSLVPVVDAAELLIGTSHVSITPERPVSLAGQHHTRIAREVECPCTATAVALESREDGKVLDQAVMVSCDLISIRGGIEDMFREKMASRLPDLDLKKVFFNGTHTHTAPTMLEGNYELPKDIMQPREFVDFVTDRLCDLVIEAWKSRNPGGVSWGLGHAVVAFNRRVVYADGSARMYGPTHVANFRRIEGPQDHGVEVLFFWDKNKKLIATAVNVACPSQEVESRRAVNADFWHEVRRDLHKRYGKDLCVLAWTGAAGDQSPHLQWREKAEERMRKKRGLTRKEEIARRIVRAVDDAYEVAKSDIHYDVPLVHVAKQIKLPVRMVTDEEYTRRKVVYDKLAKKKETTEADRRTMTRYKRVMDRYETQKDNPFCEMELHVLRLGDVAIATNRFELYTDYGIQ